MRCIAALLLPVGHVIYPRVFTASSMGKWVMLFIVPLAMGTEIESSCERSFLLYLHLPSLFQSKEIK